MMKTISFVVPVYNVGRYLVECVESLYDFAKSNGRLTFEMLLVDDGSTDGSGDICDRYLQDKRNDESFVVKVFHQTNSGVSVARNVGLDNATGEWIWFVDADDVVAPVKLMIPDCELLMFGYKWFCSDERKEMPNYPQDDCVGMDKDEFLSSHGSYLNQTMLFKRDVIEKHSIRFTPGMKMGEDLEFQYKFLMVCEKPSSISEYLYRYRVAEGSATNNENSNRNIVKDSVPLFNNLLLFIKQNHVVEKAWLAERLSRQMKTMLYSACFVKGLDKQQLQKDIRSIMDGYASAGYSCFVSKALKLARKNVSLYLLLNKLYFKFRK